MIRPNFFIVGAPKCGTTALSEYLRDRPDVFMTLPKEPGYFSDDYPGLQFVDSLEQYEALFSQVAGGEYLAVGEASPSYLMSKNAVRRIHKYNPDARLIVMLRNPVEMLPSYHGQLLFSLFEDREDFAEAWNLQRLRAEGKNIPSTCRDPGLLQYREVVCFGSQMQRVYQYFPREQVLVILFDELRHSPREVYKRTLSFLGLPDDHRKEFPVINAAKRAKSGWLNRWLHTRPRAVMWLLGQITGSRLLSSIIRLHGRIKRINVRKRKVEAVTPLLRQDIFDSIEEEIRVLSTLVDNDLHGWTERRGNGNGKS